MKLVSKELEDNFLENYVFMGSRKLPSMPSLFFKQLVTVQVQLTSTFIMPHSVYATSPCQCFFYAPYCSLVRILLFARHCTTIVMFFFGIYEAISLRVDELFVYSL